LITVLWTVVLLTLMAMMVMTLSRTQTHLARRFADSTVAEAAADSAINLTLLRLSAHEPGLLTGALANSTGLPEFVQRISVSVQREAERVDLNAAGAGTLTACFLSTGVTPEEARSRAARVIDWRDADDVAGPGGAESAEYRAAGLGYGPRNAPFQSAGELRRVLGLDNIDISTLSRFTVYTHESDSQDTADDGSFRCMGARRAGATSSVLIGEVVRIRACSIERVRLCRVAVVRLTGSSRNPFQIFLWRTSTTSVE